MFADTVRACGAVPEAGVADSQAASSLWVNVSVPDPLFVTLTVCVPGFAPPWAAENASVAGATASVGGGVTVSVTGMVFGEPVAPEAVTVTLPLYVPAPRPEMLGVTVSVCGAVPEAGDTVIHVASSEAVNDSVPAPVLDTSIVLAAGSVPPAVAENDRLDGETPSTGCGGSTVSVTATVLGEPLVPAAPVT